MIDLTGLTHKEWELRYPNFRKSELACPCCGLLNPDLDFLDIVQRIRDEYGIPMFVNSMCRCEKHNKDIDGHPNSRHIASKTKKSDAIDISVVADSDRGKLIELLELNGIKHFGISKVFIHFDGKNKYACWLYPIKE